MECDPPLSHSRTTRAAVEKIRQHRGSAVHGVSSRALNPSSGSWISRGSKRRMLLLFARCRHGAPRSAPCAGWTSISAMGPQSRARWCDAEMGSNWSRTHFAQLAWCTQAGVRRAIFTHCGSAIVRGDARKLNAKLRRLCREQSIDARIACDGDRLCFPDQEHRQPSRPPLAPIELPQGGEPRFVLELAGSFLSEGPSAVTEEPPCRAKELR